LQKSMDLTPLLPNAGPTGGEGLACPAPTMSLTIWFFCGTRDMVVVVVVSPPAIAVFARLVGRLWCLVIIIALMGLGGMLVLAASQFE